MAKLLTAATPISYYLVVVNIVAFILYGTDKATGQRMNITAQRSHRIIAVWIKMVTVRMIRTIF